MSDARAALVVTLLLLAPNATAQPPSRSASKERLIEQALAVTTPDAVPIFQQATAAFDRRDYVQAARLYREVLSRDPAFSPAMRRLAGALTESGRPHEGLVAAEDAVRIERSPENLFTLAEALADPEIARDVPAASEKALGLAKEASSAYQGKDDPGYLALTAHLALSLHRALDFRQAVTKLSDVYPDAMATHYFQAIAAAIDERWLVAEDEIEKARQLGLPSALADELLASGVRMRGNISRALRAGLYVLAAWVGGLLLMFGAGKILSGATLSSIDVRAPEGAPTAAELLIRKFYRAIIRFAGLYYYMSLPVVLVLVIGGTAGLIYAFITLGYIPIKIAFIAIAGAAVTAFKLVQSLFIRVESEDPGRALGPSEAAGLWDLTRQVARAVNTRPIDEIRVTHGTEMAVYERGSARERRQDRGQRVLVLGVGLLDGLRQSSFSAVLAHEYGHFSHRDTAGGDIALRVRQDMTKFAVAMFEHGQAVPWNLAFQFLRVYDFLFRRISHGATRLQEVLADRLAARRYGAAAFEEGLRHVVRRQIVFGFTATLEITHALEQQRPLQNLYEQRVMISADVEREVEDALRRPTTEDDTHPGPEERFRLIRGLTGDEPARPGMVWDLFSSPQTLMAEMTAVIDEHLDRAAATP